MGLTDDIARISAATQDLRKSVHDVSSQPRDARGRWTVLYQRGGTHNFSWHESVSYKTKEEAEKSRQDVMRSGYPAVVVPSDHVKKRGLPKKFMDMDTSFNPHWYSSAPVEAMRAGVKE